MGSSGGGEEKALGHRTPPGLRLPSPLPHLCCVPRGLLLHPLPPPHTAVSFAVWGGGYSPTHLGGQRSALGTSGLPPGATTSAPSTQGRVQSPGPPRGLAPPPILRRAGALGESSLARGYGGMTEEKQKRRLPVRGEGVPPDPLSWGRAGLRSLDAGWAGEPLQGSDSKESSPTPRCLPNTRG